MKTSESLYNAVSHDDLNLLTPGSIADYGFDSTNKITILYLFGAYKSISKFITEDEFINIMHNALLDENLHEKVEELTKKLPENYQEDWNNFILNGGKISPFYF